MRGPSPAICSLDWVEGGVCRVGEGVQVIGVLTELVGGASQRLPDARPEVPSRSASARRAFTRRYAGSSFIGSSHQGRLAASHKDRVSPW